MSVRSVLANLTNQPHWVFGVCFFLTVIKRLLGIVIRLLSMNSGTCLGVTNGICMTLVCGKSDGSHQQ